MAELTFSHLSSDNFERESQKKAGRKRPRIREAVSCRQCRSRKVRCDREKPCFQCVERGVSARCIYNRSRSAALPKTDNLNALSQVFPLDSTGAEPSPPQSPRSSTADEIQAGRSGSSDGQQQQQQAFATIETTKGSPDPHTGHDAQQEAPVVGTSHWLLPCRELQVARDVVHGAVAFKPGLETFTARKECLRQEDFLPPWTEQVFSTNAIEADVLSMLWSLLPDRPSCEKWIGCYFRGYGRLFPLVDVPTMAASLEQVFSTTSLPPPPDALDTISTNLLRTAVAVGLGMQMSETYRVRGRRLGRRLDRLVEYFLLSPAQIQKPCLSSMQVLVMLILLRVISASDTDSKHDTLSLFGLATHMATAINLHRDPALLDRGMSPCDAELHKRIWAVFFQLNLAYCFRIGIKLNLRLEDVTCPLPSAEVPPAFPTPPGLDANLVAAWTISDEQTRRDAAYAHDAAVMGVLTSDVFPALCSSRSRISAEKQDELHKFLDKVIADMPNEAVPDPIRLLQHAILYCYTRGTLLTMALNNLMGSKTSPVASSSGDETLPSTYECPMGAARKLQLKEIWDHAMSVVGHFLELFQAEGPEPCGTGSSAAASSALATGTRGPDVLLSSELRIMAAQLIWSHTSRAALAISYVSAELNRLDTVHKISYTAPSRPYERKYHAASVIHEMLVRLGKQLARTFSSQYDLGPVTARKALLMGVDATTSGLYDCSEYDGTVALGGAVTNEIIEELNADLNRCCNLSEDPDMPALPASTTATDTTYADTSANADANVSIDDGGNGNDSTLLPPLDSTATTAIDTIVSSRLSNTAAIVGASGFVTDMDAAVLGLANAYTWSPDLHNSYHQQCLSNASSSEPYLTTPDFMSSGSMDGDGGNMVNLEFDIIYPDMGYPYLFSMPPGCPETAQYDADAENFPDSTFEDPL